MAKRSLIPTLPNQAALFDRAAVDRLAAKSAKFTAASVFATYRARKAPNTLARQRADLDAFAVFLQSQGVTITADQLAAMATAWQGITHGIVAAFQASQIALGFAIKSVNVRMSTLRKYCELATQAGVIPADELAKIRTLHGVGRRDGRHVDAKRTTARIGTKKPAAHVLTDEQSAALLDVGQDPKPHQLRDMCMMLLMLDHSLRVGEVVAIDTNNVDLAAGMLTFYREKVDKTQTHKLTKRTAAALAAYLPHVPKPRPGPLFCRADRAGQLMRGRITRHGVGRIVREYGQAIGLADLSPHDLRHTWATNATKANTPIDRLVSAGGWNSPAVPLNVYIKPAAIANTGVLLSVDE